MLNFDDINGTTIQACLDDYASDFNNLVVSNIIWDSVQDQGVRIRPYLFDRTYRITSKKNDSTAKISFGIELIQQSTLIIDDCLDHSSLRNGRPSAYKVLGYEKATSIGQIFLSDGFRLIVDGLTELGVENAVEVLAEISVVHRDIYVGQYLDLVYEKDARLTEKKVLEVIWRTTARFIQCPIVIAAMISGVSKEVLDNLREFGINLGMAYQLRDDVLDLTASSLCTGKPECGDLSECKMRFPLVLALRNANDNRRKWAISLLNRGQLTSEETEEMRRFVNQFGGVDCCIEKVGEYGGLAINSLKCLSSSMEDFSVDMQELIDMITTFDF